MSHENKRFNHQTQKQILEIDIKNQAVQIHNLFFKIEELTETLSHQAVMRPFSNPQTDLVKPIIKALQQQKIPCVNLE